MRSWLVRHLIFPLHEWSLGRDTPRFARELEDSQWWSPDGIRALQSRKLAALLHHARTNTLYYRDLFAQAGVEPHDDGKVEKSKSRKVEKSESDSDLFALLHGIPLLSKADIRRNLETMIWREAPGGVFSSRTGGSTGEPLQYSMDRRRQAYDQAARIRAHRWFGVEPGDRELYVWGSPIEMKRTDRLRAWRDRLFNQRLLDAFHMSPERMDRYVAEWRRFRPRCVFGYPSSVALLIEHARASGHCLDSPGLRAVFVTGEVCYPHQREAVTSFLGVPVADGYGSREGGFIAHQCPSGRMHVTAENLYVEIVRDGRPVPPGETGEIVITHLDNYAMPLIRYCTGDVGRLRPGRCECGRGLPVMDVVQGRTTDFLYLPNGVVKHALSVIYPLREMSGVRRFRVLQDADCALTVQFVPNGASCETKDAVARAVRSAVGDVVKLHVEEVSEIPVTGSGKFRYVQSRVQRCAPMPQGEPLEVG